MAATVTEKKRKTPNRKGAGRPKASSTGDNRPITGSRLSAQQRRFVDAYAGNATEAARIAGYNHPTRLGGQLVRIPHIAAAIRAREDTRMAPHIADREERQAFWTAMMRDTNKTPTERLKASELLGRSEGDFIDRVVVGIEQRVKSMSDEELERRIALLTQATQTALPLPIPEGGEVIEAAPTTAQERH